MFSGNHNITWYASTMSTKYLIRQVKSVDRLILDAHKGDPNAAPGETATEDASFMEATDELGAILDRRKILPGMCLTKPIISLLLLISNNFAIAKNHTAALSTILK